MEEFAQGSKFFPFGVDPFQVGGKKTNVIELTPLKLYPFPFASYNTCPYIWRRPCDYLMCL